MRKFGCVGILLILIIAVLAYQQWQIHQLKTGSNNIVKMFKGQSGAKPDLATALAQAESRTKKAKDLIAKKKYKEAQAELDKALRSLKSANMVSENIISEAASMLGKAKDDLVRAFQGAWNDISREAKPREKK